MSNLAKEIARQLRLRDMGGKMIWTCNWFTHCVVYKFSIKKAEGNLESDINKFGYSFLKNFN